MYKYNKQTDNLHSLRIQSFNPLMPGGNKKATHT